MRRLSSNQRLFLNMVITAVILVFGIWIASGLLNPEQTKAAWFDGNWLYRTSIPITNSSGSELTNYQILIATDTAQMITEGKLQSDCDDLRIVNANGTVLPHWVETGAKGCNTAVTNIWVKVPVIPTSGGQLFLYYANTSAQNIQNGNKVFEFFDDFSGNSLNTTKWTTGTIGATSGTDFTVGGGLLTGGNTNRTLTSVKAFTGNYSAEARTYTTTSPVNGFTPIGFWSSTANGWALLDHNATSYYRNDATWVNFAYNGNTQWTRNTTKVVGTTGTYARVGETSGSATSTGTNSGISNENIRLSARSDNSATNQDYAADWDWILVRKAVATEPTTSFATEEQSPAPVAYWKFDEGTGSIANDAISHLNGTITGATWKPASECVRGSCLYFNGLSSGNKVDVGSSTKLNPSNFTISTWIKYTGTSDVYNYIYSAARDCCTTHNGISFYISSGKLRGTIWNSSAVSIISDANVPTNEWVYVSLSYDGSTLKLYQNGKLIKSASTAVGVGAPATYNYQIGTMGYSAGTYTFKGYIDDLKVYPYARSAAQVQSDYSSRGSVKGIAASFGNTDTSPLSNGLVGYWKMDEASWNGTAGEVIDSSNNGNNGTSVLGTLASPSAKFGNAGYFAGNDEAISVADSASLDLGDTLTISLWAKRGVISVNNYLMQKDAGPYAIGFNASNQLYLDMPGTGNIFTSTAAFTDTSSYHHIVFAKKGSSLYVYFDGVSVPGAFTNRTLTNNSSALYLGSNSGNTAARYGGNMDEVRLYNRQLSPNEIQQLYAFAPGPIFYTPLDEGTGTTTPDVSGNNYTGTFTGSTSPEWTQGKYGKGLKFTRGSTNRSAATVSTGPLSNLRNHSVSFWFKFTQLPDASYRKLFGYHTTSDRNPAVWTCPSLLSFHWKLDPGNTGSNCQGPTGDNNSQFTLNQWYHIEVTKEGTVGVVYINGIRINALTFVDVNGNGTGTMYLGSDTSYGSPGFVMDEFKIYNYARTPGQVVSDMNAGHPVGGSPVSSQTLYAKFDEGYGTVTHNSGNAGSSLDGTLIGMASPATVNSGWSNDGKFGKTLAFDGVDDKVTTSGVDLTTGDWTMSAWVYPTAFGAQWRRVFEAGASGGYGFGFASGSLDVTVTNLGDATASTVTPSLNQWSYIAATFIDASNTLTYYVNGKRANSVTFSTAPTAGVKTRYLGGFYAGGFYSGFIDEAKIYSAALSDSEVRVDYNRGSSLVLGATSDTSGLTGGSVASNSASAAYCIPGDTTSCSAPVAEWKFEEHSGTTANDTSGNGKTANITGGRWTQGKIGGGLNFNGTSDTAQTASTVDLSGTSAVTLEYWGNRPAYTNADRASFELTSNTNSFTTGFLIDEDSGAPVTGSIQVNIRGDGGNNCFAIARPSINTWHHYVFILDKSQAAANEVKAYIDGIQRTATQCSAPDNNNNTNNFANATFYMKARGGSSVFDKGTLDDVKLYSYARSAAQVAYDYNRGKPVVQWKMDECQGSTLNDSIGTSSGTITIGATGTQSSVGTCSTSSTAWGNGATGKFNYSLNFDGTDDYATIPQPPIAFNPNKFTIAGYIKPGNQTGFIITPNSNGIDQWIGYENTNQRLYVNIAQSADTNVRARYSTTNSVPLTTWTHFAVTIDGLEIRIYINGKLNASYTESIAIGNWTGTWYIGQRSNSTFWYLGQMDDLQVFNYALTNAQVKTLMNQGGAVRFGPSTGTP